MLKLAINTLRNLVRQTQGSEIAEAAAVLPVMFTVMLGIFWFGQAFSIYGTITRAAQEGARAGAAPICSTCSGGNTAATNAYNALQASMTIAKLDSANAQPSPASLLNSCTGGSPPACSSVSSHVCIQTGVLLSSTGSGSTPVCGISVTFQYPFQFWLPFTSLNKQKIWMTAAAQARMETQ